MSRTASAQKVPVPLRGSEAAGLEPCAEGGLFRTDRSTEASEARAALAFPPRTALEIVVFHCTTPF